MKENASFGLSVLKDIAKTAILSLTEEELQEVISILKSERKKVEDNGEYK